MTGAAIEKAQKVARHADKGLFVTAASETSNANLGSSTYKAPWHLRRSQANIKVFP